MVVICQDSMVVICQGTMTTQPHGSLRLTFWRKMLQGWMSFGTSKTSDDSLRLAKRSFRDGSAPLQPSCAQWRDLALSSKLVDIQHQRQPTEATGIPCNATANHSAFGRLFSGKSFFYLAAGLDDQGGSQGWSVVLLACLYWNVLLDTSQRCSNKSSAASFTCPR